MCLNVHQSITKDELHKLGSLLARKKNISNTVLSHHCFSALGSLAVRLWMRMGDGDSYLWGR